MEELNGKQNERIGIVETEVKNLNKNLDRFMTNDFEHLRQKVNWLVVLVILGILVPIVLFIIK